MPRCTSRAGRLRVEPDQCAPAFVDAEVMSVLRRDVLRGVLDGTAGALAVEDLRGWLGERIPLSHFSIGYGSCVRGLECSIEVLR